MKQGDVYSIEIRDVQGNEVEGKGEPPKRPCVIVSPDPLVKNLGVVMVAPLTSQVKNFPFRSRAKFLGKDGEIMTDQIMTIDKSRLSEGSYMGSITKGELNSVLEVLRKLFAKKT
jgi:mRNA interferase MazF